MPDSRSTPSRARLSEKPLRSFVKAVSWRVTGTVDTMVISFLVTGRVKWALSIGAIELFTKVTLYYLHERVWDRISLGRQPVKEDYTI
jgi:uncharacterized membrane protein